MTDEKIQHGQSDRGEDNASDPKAFILKRARSEVHLLLDYVSANPQIALASLISGATPQGLPKRWIEEVCEITWPPKANQDNEDLAKEAALLIGVRDYLNRLAKPASGATIAFTLMVTQEENATATQLRNSRDERASPSRSSLACEAYPDLVARADKFRFLMLLMVGFSIFALVATLFLSSYLAYGNAALADYATARTHLFEAQAQVSRAQSSLNGDSVSTNEAAAESTPPAKPPIPPTQLWPARPPADSSAAIATAPGLAPLPTSQTYAIEPCTAKIHADAYPSAALRDACAALRQKSDTFNAVRDGLSHWGPWARPETAGWMANLLGSAILPVLYGFLGAIAAVVRSLSRKIKASLLSPRDAQLSCQQLALGVLIGACVSLFIGAPSTGHADATLLGPVGLSTSAISFVAGFGVDAVFQAIETLIARIFNIAPPARSQRADAAA